MRNRVPPYEIEAILTTFPPPDHTTCYVTAKSSLQPSIRIFRKSNLVSTVYTQDKKTQHFPTLASTQSVYLCQPTELLPSLCVQYCLGFC